MRTYRRGQSATIPFVLVDNEHNLLPNEESIIVRIAADGGALAIVNVSIEVAYRGWYWMTLPAELTNAEQIIVDIKSQNSMVWRDIMKAESIQMYGVGAETLEAISARIEERRMAYLSEADAVDLVAEPNRYNEWRSARLVAMELETIVQIINDAIAQEAADGAGNA